MDCCNATAALHGKSRGGTHSWQRQTCAPQNEELLWKRCSPESSRCGARLWWCLLEEPQQLKPFPHLQLHFSTCRSGSPVQERRRHVGESSVKNHEDDEGTRASHMWGKAERGGTVHPGEQEAQEGINAWRDSANSIEPGSSQWCPEPGEEALGTNWNTVRSVWTTGNVF